MKIIDFLELFFVIAAAMAMPFIVIGGYFTFFPNPKERQKPEAIFFLIIAIIFALIYSYFAGKGVQKTANGKRIIKEEQIEEGRKK